MGLFDDQTESVVKAAVERAKLADREAGARNFDLAIDYLERRMVSDVESELQLRFPNAQAGNAGQRMEAIVIPLVERYIEEAATLYSGTVTRQLLKDDGEPDGDATEKAVKMIADSAYDETMSAVEQRGTLLKSCGALYQEDDEGRFDPMVVVPQDVLPVDKPRDNGMGGNPSNPSSYQGHVVTLFQDDGLRAKPTLFAFIERDKTRVFEGQSPAQAKKLIDTLPNIYAPHMPLVIWHPEKPSTIIPSNDVPIAISNREINVLWSVLFHLFRFQSGSTLTKLILKVSDDNQPTSPHGPMFPIVMGAEEVASYINPGVQWEELVAFLQSHIKLVANMLSMSPADFDLEGQTIASGFAKIIDSLPKIESRRKRAKWASIQEARNWPLLRAALMHQKDGAALPEGLRLVTVFDELEIPRAVTEEIQRDGFDIEHGLTTPAEILAKRKDVTTEDAQAMIDENKRAIAPTTLAGIIARSGPESSAASSPVSPSVTPQAGGDAGGDATVVASETEPETKTSATPETVFNGAQIASLVEIVKEVTAGQIPFETGVKMIELSFNLEEAQARAILEPTIGFDPRQEQTDGTDDGPPTRRDRSEGGPGSGGQGGGEAGGEAGPTGRDETGEGQGGENSSG